MIVIYRLKTSVDAQRVTLSPDARSVWTGFDGRMKQPGPNAEIVTGELSLGTPTDWLLLEPGALVVRTSLLDSCDSLIYALCNDLETFGIRTPSGPLQAYHPYGRRPKGTRGPCSVAGSYYMPAFRIEGQSPFDLFTTHGFAVHPDDDLKTICEEHSLTGLEFEEFWRGPIEDLV